MTSAATRAGSVGSAAVSFGDRLAAAADRSGSGACVGLDPTIERLPAALRPSGSASRAACADAIESFSLGALDAIAGAVAIVKPQSACFERYGWEGVRALQRVCAGARERGLVVILDVKRGDIDVTAAHYAAAAFEATGADAATVNAYLGADTLTPWLERPAGAAGRGTGVFVLVRTSNPGSDGVQSAALADGETVAERMARLVHEAGAGRVGASGWSDVGAVVGATKPADAARLRERMPAAPILVPGWGAQGGSPETVRLLSGPSRGGAFRGAVVSASRSVIYAFEAGSADWQGGVRDAAAKLRDDIRAIG